MLENEPETEIIPVGTAGIAPHPFGPRRSGTRDDWLRLTPAPYPAADGTKALHIKPRRTEGTV